MALEAGGRTGSHRLSSELRAMFVFPPFLQDGSTVSQRQHSQSESASLSSHCLSASKTVHVCRDCFLPTFWLHNLPPFFSSFFFAPSPPLLSISPIFLHFPTKRLGFCSCCQPLRFHFWTSKSALPHHFGCNIKVIGLS